MKNACKRFKPLQIWLTVLILGLLTACDAGKPPSDTTGAADTVVSTSADTTAEEVTTSAPETEVHVHASIRKLGTEFSHPFQRCDALADIYYGGTQTQWEAIAVADDYDPFPGDRNIYFNAKPQDICLFGENPLIP